MTITIDSSLYYTEEFIQELIDSGQKNVVIIDSSLSDSALQAPRSVHIGSRQSRSLPSSLLLAQRLKQAGISLKIYYLAIDNTMHFNQKDKRHKDNRISQARLDYILNFAGIPLDKEQFEAVYINPRYRQKEGDIIEAELPVVHSIKGEALALTGENAVILRALRDKLAKHGANGEHIIGMTAHSGGKNLKALASYLGVSLIGTSDAGLKYGTKEGNKTLLEFADAPHVYGSQTAQKDYLLLLDDCCDVAENTGCKKLIIKLNSSSAGKGNLEVDITACYGAHDKAYDDETRDRKIRQAVYDALISHRHPEKDRDILDGVETFYMRKLRELGAIVEAKLEGHDIVSPGSIAVVGDDGYVTVEYIYDQVLSGKQGQNFGGSMGPSELSPSQIDWIYQQTEYLGQKFYELGGRGYFGLDFLLGSDIEPIIIEGNLRKTGTKYPWILLLLLIGREALNSKTLFHDDNITLPIGINDLTGREESMNHFMDCFHQWVALQDVHFDVQSKSGAIISFDSHTAGKLGVLFVGDSRAEVQAQRERFVELLELFSHEVYPHFYLRRQYAGTDISKMKSPHPPIELEARDFRRPRLEKDKIVSKQSKSPVSDRLYRVRRSLSLTHGTVQGIFRPSPQDKPGKNENKVVQNRSKTLTHATTGQIFRPESTKHQAAQRKTSKKSKRTAQYRKTSIISGFFPKEQWDELRKTMRKPAFVILGRTRTSDGLLIEATKNRLRAYRMTEVSRYHFDENTRCGYVSHVTVPQKDPRTGLWKMVFDDTHKFPLPTVVYDYDFSERRQKAQQARGDRTILDKTQKMRAFFDLIGAVYLNNNKSKTYSQSFIAPTQSPIALMQALKKHAPEIHERSPKIITCNDSSAGKKSIAAFITAHPQFYSRPAMTYRNKNLHLGSVYIERVTQGNSTQPQLHFSFFVESKDNGHQLEARQYTSPLSSCSGEVFMNILNKIKADMGVSQDHQFLLQEALDTPEINDAAGRALSAKLRIVTLHHPTTGEVVVSSSYGLYGGDNAYLAYVGSLSIYLNAYFEQHPPMDNMEQVDQDILKDVFKTAIDTHKAAELASGYRQGEMITDIALTPKGPVPMKTHSKPERPDLERVAAQTHFGQILEGSPRRRDAFVEALRINEKERERRILKEALRLHREVFVPKEQTLKEKVDSMRYLNSGTMVVS